MESFITKDGKKLRRGYTTGTCAAAAAKAAAIMLLSKKTVEAVYIITPRGTELKLNITDINISENNVSCAVTKDSGDDPDVTNGIKIYACVTKTNEKGNISIEGGSGVGRVTKPGLDQPVGNAAINSTPRKMIEAELISVMEDFLYTGGLSVIISVPHGEEIAKKTFNPRLGIVGGISILGTTGIVEPMSDSAVIETIKTELSMRKAAGKRFVLMTPGNYGADYIKKELKITPESAVTTSNFIGEAFSAASSAEFEGALLVGHIGKLIKLAGGMFNTHSKYGDCRAEIFASHAALCGADKKAIEKIMNSAMTDDMISVCRDAGIFSDVMKSIISRIELQLSSYSSRYFGNINAGVLIFSNEYGTIGKTANAEMLIDKIKAEENI